MSAAQTPEPVDDAALLERAAAWLAQDPDPVTQAELAELLRTEALSELNDRFGTRLAFGTAGLRGRQGAGTNRMNRVLIAQTARGFAEFLLDRAATGATATPPSIVIGYDARINSDVYARDTAEIMAAAGIRATLLPKPLPTPVLAFAVRHLDASAGVMVTASHNPKWDNGYKVYLGDADGGSQIVSPADAEIAAAIDRVAARGSIAEIPRSQDFFTAGDEVEAAYCQATARVFRGEVAPLHVAYTALHGVGWGTFRRVLDELGIPHPAVVTAQIEPDGTFPTLEFPNPEEPGALDLAMAEADRVGADLILANDPDADRLAVAVRDAASPSGWAQLGGNVLGRLLGWRAAMAAQDAGVTSGADRPTLATSLVSSPALSRVAAAYGLHYEETPTGFKWISRAPGIAFGYEEALGYLVNPETLHDKDGISAAIAVLELAMGLARDGRTLLDLDEEFAERFGAFESIQESVRFADAAEIPRIMAALRANLPTEIAGRPVTATTDLAAARPETVREHGPERARRHTQQPANIIRFDLADGTRLMVRPSGTEPKIKCYADAVGEEGSLAERRTSALTAARDTARGMAELLRQL